MEIVKTCLELVILRTQMAIAGKVYRNINTRGIISRYLKAMSL